MNKITEIIFGDSTYFSMSNSVLNKNEIIKFNTLFSIGDLSDIDTYNIYIPNEICNETIYNFSKEINILNESINNNNKIRIWYSLKDSDEYILLTYLCDYLKNKKCDLYAVCVNDYDKVIHAVSLLREDELEKASHYEKKISVQDIENLSNIWKYIKINPADIRLMINNKVELVSYDYFDDIILNRLRELGRVKESKLVANLLEDYHLIDLLFVYLIDRLVSINKIRIVEESEERVFNNIIEVSI